MSANFEKSAVTTRLEKVSYHSILKKGNAKQCSNYCTICVCVCVCVCVCASKVMLKILSSQASTVCEPRTSRCTSCVEKRQQNQRWNCQHLLDHRKSKGISGKYLPLLHWLCQSLWLYASQQTVENSWRDGNTKPPYLHPEKLLWKTRSNN